MEELIEEEYSTAEVCKILGEKIYNLKYMEKKLGIHINTKENSRRSYSKENLELLKNAFRLKSSGLGYEKIKNQLITNIKKESEPEIKKKNLNLDNTKVNKPANTASPQNVPISIGIQLTKEQNELINSLTQNIANIIDKKLNNFNNNIANEFNCILKQNGEIKSTLETETTKCDSCFNIISDLKNNVKKKKGFFR